MKMSRFISLLILFVMALTVLSLPAIMLGQDEEPPTTENATIPDETPEIVPIAEEEEEEATITLSSEFPKIEAIATGSFDYTVKLEYEGKADRIFDLNTTVPAGWSAYITPQYESIRIPSIKIDGSEYVANSKNVKLKVSPPTWPIAEPGDYVITLEAVSEDVVGNIELTARITARYSLNAIPANELYNTRAKAGRDNIFSIKVANLGTDSIDNITFSSDKPEGWEIKFTPEKIDLLEIVNVETVDVNIKPPPKTVSGDYMVTMRVSGTQASADKIAVRVTVETPTIWGWVGVAIIAVVVIGLVIIFIRFGRR